MGRGLLVFEAILWWPGCRLSALGFQQGFGAHWNGAYPQAIPLGPGREATWRNGHACRHDG